VFEIAWRTFPDAEVACLNVAVSALRDEKPDNALEHLQRCPDSPDAMNLTGVAYAKKGGYRPSATVFPTGHPGRKR